MAYLGRNPAVGTQRMLDSLESQFNGTLTTFDLRYGGVPTYPTLSESLIVSLGGVLQEPGEAYYVSSDKIVFSEAPNAGTECWILLYSQYGAAVSSVPSLAIQATGEPMGFENRTHSSISFNNGSRTFSIAPNTGGGYSSYAVWTKGTKRTISATLSVQVGTSTGLYYIYFDAFGDLQYKTTYFTWDTETPVAYVYWNSATSSAPFVADERHGVVLDWQTHEYLHRTRGAVIAEGFSISAYTTVGDGSANAHAQFDLGNGTFFDEDLEVAITHSATPTVGTFTQVLTGAAEIPVFYMSGSSGAWVRDSATEYACKQSATTLQYNSLSGGTWSTTPATNNRYVVSWIVATNGINAPIIVILGQEQYSSIGAAEAEAFGNLTLTNFPIVEFRPLWKVIFRTSSGYANTPNARIANVLDLRQLSETGEAGTVVSDHGLLSGLADDDHAQYLHTSLDREGVSANISTTGNLGGANLTLTGELRGPSTLIIDPAAVGDNTGTVEIKGNLTVQGTTTTINSTTVNVTNLKLEDNEKLYVGTGDDLQIYHSGSHSYIKHTGTGNLYTDIGAGDYYQISNSESETIASFQADGAVELYHNGSKKFETTSSGITVTGDTYFNGRIGVGTSAPQTLLEVNLTGAVANTTSSTDSSTWGPNGIVNLYNSNGSTTGNEVLLLGSQAGGVGQLSSGFGFGRESAADWGTYISFKTHSTSTSNIDELYERARIDSSGRLLVGTSSARVNYFGAGHIGSNLQVVGSTHPESSVIIHNQANNTQGSYLHLGKSRGTGYQILDATDPLGFISFQGADGAVMREGASVCAYVDGTPGSGDMPGRLVFSTTADGASFSTERMRITSAGNIGISTTNPVYKLHVVGDINFTGSLYQNGSPFASASSTWDAGTGDNIYRLLGNVGIGTTNPTSKLDVVGSIIASGTLSASSGLRTLEQVRATGWWNTPTGSSYSGLGVEMGMSGGHGYVLCYNRDNATWGNLRIQGSGGSTMIELPPSGSTINVTGNIDASGIVRATGGRLVLRDDSLENHATDSDIASVVINYAGYLSGSTRFRDFHLYNGKAGLILKAVGSSGNVGIGSTSPTSKLDVVGTVTATNFGDATGGYNVNLGSSGTAGFTEGRGLVAGHSGGSYGGIGYNVRHTTTGGTYIAPIADYSSYIVFNQGFTFLGDGGGAAGRTVSYSNLARLDNSGNLTQYASGSYHRIAYSSGSDNYSSTMWWNGLALGNNGDNFIVAGRTAVGGSLKFYVNNTNDIKTNATPGGTLALTLASTGSATFGGNVGIGITPYCPLTVAAASTQDNATYQSWVYSPGSENLYRLDLKQTVTSNVVRYNFSMINNGTAYNDVLVLDRGRVGIGNTNPADKLHVYGGRLVLDNPLTDQTAIQFNQAGVEMAVLYRPASISTQLRMFITGGGDVMTWNNSGNVGIGTTIPTEKLEVNGNLLVGSSTYNNSSSPIIRLGHRSGNLATGSQRGVIQFDSIDEVSVNSGDAWKWKIAAVARPGSGGNYNSQFEILRTTRFGVTDNTDFCISRSGNIGVGVTDPQYKLEVNGSFAATTKSFIIPHPTKENYKLRHGSLEGPENGVYVRGKSDSGVIELPEYWTGLVDPDSITVNLTPIGQNSPLWVERIEDNKVYVGREDALASYFYTVFAERIDVPSLDVEIKIQEDDE